MSLVVAVAAMRTGMVPAVAGLRRPSPRRPGSASCSARRQPAARVAQVDAFGFGGVNAVALVGTAA